MFRLLFLSLCLALRDWLHERSLSFCGVLALASMLAPLLVLHGVHMGVIERLRENLMRDPAVLVLIPSGGSGAGFEEDFIRKVSEQPGCRFCIGRTRDILRAQARGKQAGRNDGCHHADLRKSRYNIACHDFSFKLHVIIEIIFPFPHCKGLCRPSLRYGYGPRPRSV